MNPDLGGASRTSWLQDGITDIAVRAQERRAHRLMVQGDLSGAIRVYQEILRLDPDCARAHYQLGLCYRQRRQWSDAVEAFLQAVSLGETRAEPYLIEVRKRLPSRDGTIPSRYSDCAADGDGVADDGVGPAVVVGGHILTPDPPEVDRPTQEPTPSPSKPSPGVAEPKAGYAARGGPSSAAQEEVARQPIVCPPVDDVFAPGGPLARSLGERYRARSGQVQMAALVRNALETCRHAIVEAGTGIGKSFAYLVPILWSGTAAVVSTSNKGLMNQLWEKDIPWLQRLAPKPVKAALLKGRSNYICALRLERLLQQALTPERAKALDAIRKGLERVPWGDMELIGLAPELAARLTVGSRDCHGYRCPQFESCYYEQAKRSAAQADLVVTNHALLCYSALLAENHILPVRPVLVIDEAHQLPRYAVEALTLALEHEQFWGLVNGPQAREAAGDGDVLADLRAGYDGFFQTLAQQRPGTPQSARRPTRWPLRGELQTGLALWDALHQLQRTLAHATQLDEGEREAALQQSEELATTVHALSLPEPETHVRLCELSDEGNQVSAEAYHACYQPLEVAAPLRRMLFDAWPRVICTSATLSIGGDLGWFRRQVGLFETGDDNQVIGATLKSPFDYNRQMLLYTPRALTPVYDAEQQAFAGNYVDELTAEVHRLLEASRGRALVLCTSRTRMNQLYETLAPTLRSRYPCYLQGDYAQPELVTRFRRDGNAILFATRGYWEGLDIPGDALALVILDKIPFVPFDDPLIRRQEARIRARGGNPFYELQLGTAILNLRQGAGRLIRSETDRGVIALLDARVVQKAYGRQIIQSLPEGCHTLHFEDVAAFLS